MYTEPVGAGEKIAMMITMIMMIDDDDTVFFKHTPLSLVQPVDVSSTYRLGLRLHELELKRKPKKWNSCIERNTKVKSAFLLSFSV